VGSSQSIKVDVRIVGATNANLKSLADSGRFLTDLLDRLSFEVLVLPPLRDRLEDIAILSNHFAARMGFELGWDQIPEVTEEAMEMMERYEWPGNVRELKNVIERAVYRSDDYVITKEELEFDPFRAYLASHSVPGEAAMEEGQAPPTQKNAPVYSLATSFQDQLKQLEAGLVETSLEESKFNQKKAAELLGLTYHQFRGLYRKYQEPPENGG
jgi:psp operon transcriptional activator